MMYLIRLSIQNIAGTYTTPEKKTQKSNYKMGREHEQTFSQKIHTEGQQTHEKMPNITHHQENTKQNYEIQPHTSQNG